MAIPAGLEPFVDDDPQRGWWGRVAPRLARHPATFVLAVSGLGLLVWIDAAGEGAVVAPLESPRTLGVYLVVCAAAAIGSAAFPRSRRADSGAVIEAARLPVFLRFDQRDVVVVGGGAVAASKLPALLAAGARVTVVAPRVSTAIDRTRVRVVERAFEPRDLDGAWFVTAAATPAVNREVRLAADQRAIFVNAADDPANATAYLGGTIARGGVTVAFSTSGRAPALAGLLREALDDLLPADLETWLARASELREQQRRDGVPIAERRPALLDALNRLYDRAPHRR
jgi:siroheme synthase-like protein